MFIQGKRRNIQLLYVKDEYLPYKIGLVQELVNDEQSS